MEKFAPIATKVSTHRAFQKLQVETQNALDNGKYLSQDEFAGLALAYVMANKTQFLRAAKKMKKSVANRPAIVLTISVASK